MKKLGKGRNLLLVMLLIVSTVLGACGNGGGGADGEEKSYKLKMSVTVSDSSTWYEAAKKLADDMEKETDATALKSKFSQMNNYPVAIQVRLLKD